MVAPGLTPQCIKSQSNFVGYGPPNPKFILIGPEEGSEGSLVNLQIRCSVFPSPRHDRVNACRDLGAGYIAQGLHAAAQRYSTALRPGAEATWTFAAQLVAALRSPVTSWTDEYLQLGTSQGDTLLTELFPLPKPGTGTWPPDYVAATGYPNQAAYYDAVWPRRAIPGDGTSQRADLLAATLTNVPLSRSSFVFGYGRGGRKVEFWERFDRLFGVNGKWTTVITNTAEISRHASGAVVARLAHPSRNGITQQAIPLLVAAIHSLP
jgi:hypothetical protein